MQGFELTTYWSIVSFHEHYTRVPAQLNIESVGTFYLKKPVFVFPSSLTLRSLSSSSLLLLLSFVLLLLLLLLWVVSDELLIRLSAVCRDLLRSGRIKQRLNRCFSHPKKLCTMFYPFTAQSHK